jgi:hypothetical protein
MAQRLSAEDTFLRNIFISSCFCVVP